MPNWQGQEAPPPSPLGILPWHRPDLFSSSDSCRCLLGEEGWLIPRSGRGPSQSSHPLSQLRPLSLPPPPPLPQEEEIPELEIDVDELLDMESDDTRAARVKVREGLGETAGL